MSTPNEDGSGISEHSLETMSRGAIGSGGGQRSSTPNKQRQERHQRLHRESVSGLGESHDMDLGQPDQKRQCVLQSFRARPNTKKPKKPLFKTRPCSAIALRCGTLPHQIGDEMGVQRWIVGRKRFAISGVANPARDPLRKGFAKGRLRVVSDLWEHHDRERPTAHTAQNSPRGRRFRFRVDEYAAL